MNNDSWFTDYVFLFREFFNRIYLLDPSSWKMIHIWPDMEHIWKLVIYVSNIIYICFIQASYMLYKYNIYEAYVVICGPYMIYIYESYMFCIWIIYARYVNNIFPTHDSYRNMYSTYVSYVLHNRIIHVSYTDHIWYIWFIYASLMNYTCFMYDSHTDHIFYIWLMCATHVNHICFIYGSYTFHT